MDMAAPKCFVLLALVLLSSVGSKLAAGQVVLEHPSEAKIEIIGKRIEQLAELVKRNTEAITAFQSQVENQIQQLASQVQKNTETVLLCRQAEQTESENNDNSASTNEALISSTNSSGAGWIVIQQRFGNKSVAFNRSWDEYRDGFGEVGPSTEFWWGLEKIHQHTKIGNYELLIELKDQKGESRYARYSEFVVEGESEQYRLAKLGGYSGTAGDVNTLNSYYSPTGCKFTTYDRDNDRNRPGNCASDNRSGWWYSDWCGNSLNTQSYYGSWHAWKAEHLPYTRMLIRAKP